MQCNGRNQVTRRLKQLFSAPKEERAPQTALVGKASTELGSDSGFAHPGGSDEHEDSILGFNRVGLVDPEVEVVEDRFPSTLQEPTLRRIVIRTVRCSVQGREVFQDPRIRYNS